MHSSAPYLLAKAETCQTEAPFLDLNLMGIKEKVTEALALVGRGGFFGEYTPHDFGHVEKMVRSVDWIAPPATQSVMTPADCLLTLLAIYLHDLGLLVTETEFDARDESEFSAFCDRELFVGDAGVDYRSKLTTLGTNRERFLYQEYVRHHHAERIGHWIRGDLGPKVGKAADAAKFVADLLTPLPAVFRDDLAKVCESHHRDDLDDLAKYSVSQPYGDSDQVTANVQYAAILLRAADLLHVTSDRAPSIMFRLINPQNPLSQREWAKQAAVRRIRPQVGRDDDGTADPRLPQDTIEVFAQFSDAEAFFGLKSYLAYVREQLDLASEWARIGSLASGSEYEFPWRNIDSTHVTAEGFVAEPLAFSIDQAKVLDLLTGHTIYNDTGVVLRELVQNSLDAVRLQRFIDGHDVEEFDEAGQVDVEWNESSRTLIVRDNGVGMTQDVIEANLLKAGASRYQEDSFRKSYPAFSSISRFGIGVLSTFMIADEVTITTTVKDEAQARQITLQSVHGDYLLRLLDRASDAVATGLGDHGTEVTLRIRESADVPSVSETLLRWIVIPRCRVLFRADEEEEIIIDNRTPAEAVRAILRAADLELHGDSGDPADQSVKVIEQVHDGIHTAVAVQWDQYRQQWNFMTSANGYEDTIYRFAIGTCVEGVRVESTSPGFPSTYLVSLSDARGLSAPKTNVAREGLDATSARLEMLRRIYRAYLSFLTAECTALHQRRGMSLTWAAQEVEWQLKELLLGHDSFGRRRAPLSAGDWHVFGEEFRLQPLVLVEDNENRELRSVQSLQGEPELWTVDSALLRAAEGILREIPSEGSMFALSSGFQTDVFRLPDGVTLVGYMGRSICYGEALEDREVAEMLANPSRRRVDLRWAPKEADPIWLHLNHLTDWRLDSEDRFGGNRRNSVLVARRIVPIRDTGSVSALRAHEVLYILGGTPLSDWLIRRLLDDQNPLRNVARDALTRVVQSFFGRRKPPDDLDAFVESSLSREGSRSIEVDDFDPSELIDVLSRTSVATFDTWSSRGYP